MSYCTFVCCTCSATNQRSVTETKLKIGKVLPKNVLSNNLHTRAVSAARLEGLPLTLETCHHYLNLNSEDIPDRATQYKCCPPIRDLSNQELLWCAVIGGDIDMIVSDHSPCTPDLKLPGEKDFMQAWGGISSLQFGKKKFDKID